MVLYGHRNTESSDGARANTPKQPSAHLTATRHHCHHYHSLDHNSANSRSFEVNQSNDLLLWVCLIYSDPCFARHSDGRCVMTWFPPRIRNVGHNARCHGLNGCNYANIASIGTIQRSIPTIYITFGVWVEWLYEWRPLFVRDCSRNRSPMVLLPFFTPTINVMDGSDFAWERHGTPSVYFLFCLLRCVLAYICRYQSNDENV